jgi:hypothetical protein
MRALSTDCALVKDEARIDILVTLNSIWHLDGQGMVKKSTTRVLTQLDRHLSRLANDALHSGSSEKPL